MLSGMGKLRSIIRCRFKLCSSHLDRTYIFFKGCIQRMSNFFLTVDCEKLVRFGGAEALYGISFLKPQKPGLAMCPSRCHQI